MMSGQTSNVEVAEFLQEAFDDAHQIGIVQDAVTEKHGEKNSEMGWACKLTDYRPKLFGFFFKYFFQYASDFWTPTSTSAWNPIFFHFFFEIMDLQKYII